MTRLIGVLVGAAALLLFSFTLFWPTGLTPIAYEIPIFGGYVGEFETNSRLTNVPRVRVPSGTGPEDVAQGPDGRIYTGLADGRVMSFDPDNHDDWTEFADTGGRPLGLVFDAHGNLIVADAYKGLLKISSDGTIAVLADAFEGKRLVFVDDVDVTADGTLWFSDGSLKYDLHDNYREFWQGVGTGRLFAMNPETGDLKVHVEGLAFANGVALGPDDAFVVINETFRHRMTRYWIKGQKAGISEVFRDNLPGFPDNVTFDDQGTFWVSFVSPRDADLDGLTNQPFKRQVITRFRDVRGMPLPTPPLYGLVIGLDTDGVLTHNYQDPTGDLALITSANRIGDKLYLGSFIFPSIGILDLHEEEM